MCPPISRRHHFLPVFYLRQWCDDASRQPGGSPGVWRINRDGTNPRRYNPQNQVFWIEHANTLTSTDGTKTDRPEQMLGRVEDVVARTTRERIERHDALDRNEVDAINMSARTALQSGIDAQARLERETAAFEGRPVPDTSLFQANAMAHMAAASITAILDDLGQMAHRVLMAPAGSFFVTSDRPAHIHALIGSPCLANRSCEATLPLSPTRLLLMTWEDLGESGYYNITAGQVTEFNRRAIAGSHEWFVSNNAVPDPSWLQTGA